MLNLERECGTRSGSISEGGDRSVQGANAVLTDIGATWRLHSNVKEYSPFVALNPCVVPRGYHGNISL